MDGELGKMQAVAGANGSARGSLIKVVRSTIDLASRQTAAPGAAFIQPPVGRPFCDFLLALHVFLSPSGMLPGGEDDGRRRSRSSGGEHGPDRFSCYLFRVLGAYFKDCAVIFTSFRILFVKCLVTAWI